MNDAHSKLVIGFAMFVIAVILAIFTIVLIVISPFLPDEVVTAILGIVSVLIGAKFLKSGLA